MLTEDCLLRRVTGGLTVVIYKMNVARSVMTSLDQNMQPESSKVVFVTCTTYVA